MNVAMLRASFLQKSNTKLAKTNYLILIIALFFNYAITLKTFLKSIKIFI